MAQPFFTGEEIDRMKADAIKRARQMHSRSSLPNTNNQQTKKNNDPLPKAVSNKNSGNSAQGILQMIKMMGFENDQLILIALILLLSGEKDNMPIILALLYIAM